MGTGTQPYSDATLSNYNASPPPDDGTQVSANEVTWAGIKTKLPDPLKSFIEDVETNLKSAFLKGVNGDADVTNALAGSLAFTPSELTIAAGAVTATRSHHTIDTEADAASDALDTIATGSVNDSSLLIISAEHTDRTVTVTHEAGGAGQIHLRNAVDISLTATNKYILLIRSGTDWYELETQTESAFPLNYIGDLIPSIGTDASHDIDITTGKCRNSADTRDIVLASGLTKQMDVGFAEGTNQGGFATGSSLPASGTVHVFVIRNSTSGAIDVMGDQSVTGANGPAGWTVERRIGSFTTDGSNNLIPVTVVQTEGGSLYTLYNNASIDTYASSTSEQTFTLPNFPTGVRFLADINVFWSTSAAEHSIYLHPSDVDDEAPSQSAAPLASSETSGGTSFDTTFWMQILSDTSGQIQTRETQAAQTVSVVPLAWKDFRTS